MKPLPETGNALVLRTDFASNAAWESIQKAITASVGDFQAYVDFLSQREYEGATIEQVVAAAQNTNRFFLFVVDAPALAGPEHLILCIDLADEPGRSFRVVPSEMWSVENNLSLANMDFADFAGAVGEDGVFRGFPGD